MDKEAIKRRKKGHRKQTLGNMHKCVECSGAAEYKNLCFSCYNKILKDKLTND